jgi:hypothetical protein
MSIFTKAKKFFNRLYWYNNRHSSVGRASFVLDDTWDGLHSMIDYQILKVEHMFHNVKKYSCVEKSYIDSTTLVKYGTKEDKEYFFNKIFKFHFDNMFIYNEYVDKEESIDGLIGYYLYRELDEQEDSTFTYRILKRKAVSSAIDNRTCTIKSFYPLETVPSLRFEYKYSQVEHFRSFALLKKEDIAFIENVIKTDTKSKDFDFIDKVLLSQGHFLVRGQDFMNISDTLKDKVVGRNKKLLILCKLRKLLKKANFSMDYYLDSIGYYESLEAAKEILDCFENSQAEYKKELRKRLDMVSEYLVENYEQLF